MRIKICRHPGVVMIDAFFEIYEPVKAYYL